MTREQFYSMSRGRIYNEVTVYPQHPLRVADSIIHVFSGIAVAGCWYVVNCLNGCVSRLNNRPESILDWEFCFRLDKDITGTAEEELMWAAVEAYDPDRVDGSLYYGHVLECLIETLAEKYF